MFEGKVVLITGASSGVGEAAAIAFAKRGADVAFTYQKNEVGANKVAESIRTIGKKALVLKANLRNEDDAQVSVEETLRTFGRIDILVNNAGRYVEGDEWNAPSSIWTESLEQNLISVLNVSKYVLLHFESRKDGVMVNIASRHGVSGVYDAISYGAAKAGVINITEAYAKLMKGYGRANCISPSAINTGYWLTAPKEELEDAVATRGGRLLEPSDVVEKILYLASDEAKDITGMNLVVE